MDRCMGESSDDSGEWDDNGEFVPWERLPTDTPRSWQVFRVYRDLGPSRNVPQCARSVGLCRNRVRQLADKHDFVERALSWDDHCDKRYQVEFLKLQRSVAQSHLTLARALRQKAMRAFRGMTVEHLIANPTVALAMVKEAVRIEASHLRIEGPTPAEKPDPEAAYFDKMPTSKLIEHTEAGLIALKAQERRERALLNDANGHRNDAQ